MPGNDILTKATLETARRALRRRDPELRLWIDRIGTVSLRRARPYFVALCRSVVSQQLAAAAARTIYGRFQDLCGGALTPEAVLSQSEDDLRACGLSTQKLTYLRSIAEEFESGELRGARFGSMTNEDIIAKLTRIKGVGVWTAEMFLIFSVGRPDVFSIGDLALRNAVQRVVGKKLTHKQIETVAERWAPYRSVASLYLWKIAHWKAPE